MTAFDRVEVRIESEGRDVLDFSVQYLAQVNDAWHAVVRFDTAHGDPHMDVLSPTGHKETRELRRLDKRDALTYALTDIDTRWESYRDRYQRAMKK